MMRRTERRKRQRRGPLLSRRRFRHLVATALGDLPEGLRQMMANVAVVVEDEPAPEDLATMGLGPDETLYGLYVGVPLTERAGQYTMALPDRVVIYRLPICADYTSEAEIVEQVRRTVIHEVAHHFGIDDQRLAELGWD